jgi:hypothetical protein
MSRIKASAHDPNRGPLRRYRTAFGAFALTAAVAAGAADPAIARTPPSVRIESPAQGGTLTPGSTITPVVTDGIFRVEYTLTVPGAYSSTTYLLGVSDQPPFSFQWNGVPSGIVAAPDLRSLRLVAKAFDSSGAVVRSDAPVNGVQVVPAVVVPGTWATVSPRAMASSPRVSAGATNGGILAGGGVSAPITRFPVGGATATYTLTVPTAGNYDLHVAHGEIGRLNTSLRIAVNNTVVADAPFVGSVTRQASDVQQVVSVPVRLNAGANTVVLTAIGGVGPSILSVYTAASR